jgi:hypothetical protein
MVLILKNHVEEDYHGLGKAPSPRNDNEKYQLSDPLLEGHRIFGRFLVINGKCQLMGKKANGQQTARVAPIKDTSTN